MLVFYNILKNSFSVNLLVYSLKFLRFCDVKNFFSSNKYSNSISFTYSFLSKLSFLIRNNNYSYENLNGFPRFSRNKIFLLKIIEISFCFLIVSFFKFFFPVISAKSVFCIC